MPQLDCSSTDSFKAMPSLPTLYCNHQYSHTLNDFYSMVFTTEDIGETAIRYTLFKS